MSQRSIKAPIPLLVLLAATTFAACSSKTEAPLPAPEPSANAAAEARAPVADPEGVKTFTIGEYSAIALRDGGLEFPNDNTVFAVGHKPEEVSALLTAAGLPTDKLQLSLQPLLVKTADRVLLFDTGAGSNMGPNAGKLPAALTAAGVDPVSVTDIFISHFHGDHTGGLVNAQGALAFPNATIHLSAADWAFLKKLDPKKSANYGLPQLTAMITALTPKIAEFAPYADLIPGVVKAVDIKGHTPGHSGYRITSGQESLLYIGDTVHHSIISVQKPDWRISFDGDAPTAEINRAAVLTEAATNGQRIYAVHFPFPGIGKFERRGEEFVWVPET